MKENSNGKYSVTGLQCSVKMSGLKRTFKNIRDQNKKSGNCRNTWAFYSVNLFLISINNSLENANLILLILYVISFNFVIFYILDLYNLSKCSYNFEGDGFDFW